MDENARQHVAVIGAGPGGLATIKSLLEENFKVTAFDQRSGPGGIWRLDPDPKITSVTSRTRFQVDKFMGPFSDFPFDESVPRYPSAKDLEVYFQQYADHFGLSERIEWNTTVRLLLRDGETGKWLLYFEGVTEPRRFDKVVFATGLENIAKWPKIHGIARFAGKYIHGQEYKRPEDFDGKNVIVIGQGNSAVDCAVELTTNSNPGKVYLSHTRGFALIPRAQPYLTLTHASILFLCFMEYYVSFVYPLLMYLFFSNVSKQAFGELDPKWKISPKVKHANNVASVVVNDHIVDCLRNGSVESVAKVDDIIGSDSKRVELVDGTIIDDVDVIIACTGYESSLGLIAWEAIKYFRPLVEIPFMPYLYHNTFPPADADTVAVVSHTSLVENAITTRELTAMAIAQLWSARPGTARLPSREKMEAQVAQHAKWYRWRWLTNPVPQLPGLVELWGRRRWANDVAGTGMNEKLSLGWEGLSFAWKEWDLYKKLAFGVASPVVYRLFETGRRKAWSGARNELERLNEIVKEDWRKFEEEKKAAKLKL